MSKGPDAFRTISEVAEDLDLPQHVLRFWETRFAQIKPMKRGGGRRYYRPEDVELLRGIRRLLYGEGYTIKGVQRILKEQGLRHVAAFGTDGPLDPAPETTDDALDATDDGLDVELDDFEPAPRRPAARSERQEPVFESRPVMRAEPVREKPAVAPRRPDPAPEPIPSVSNFPAAPPDEPDGFEAYLPPGSIDRAEEPATPADPYRPPRAEPPHAPEPVRAAPAPEPAATRLAPQAAAQPAPQPPAVMDNEDRRTLESALAALLECKRLLDQAR